jgi:hypothetical protein
MRRSLGLLIAILAFGLVSLTVPRPAVACSCVSPDDIVANLGVSEDEAVFAGHTGPQTAAGVPVALTAWFGGPAPAAVVTLDVSEGDSASCGTTVPPAGIHYLFVSYPTGDGRYGLNLCSVAIALDGPDGQAMLGEVEAKLGPAQPVGNAPSTAPPSEPVDDPDAAVETVVPVTVGVIFAVGVAAGLFLILGRRRDSVD